MRSSRGNQQSGSSAPQSHHSSVGTRSNGLLVIGDDAVGDRLTTRLGDHDDVVFVGLSDSPTDFTGERDVEIDKITDLPEVDLETTPTAAIVATSEDSQNLLLTLHLRSKLDIEHIAVRVNEHQNIDAFVDLSVDLVDVASLVGSALIERFEPPSGTR